MHYFNCFGSPVFHDEPSSSESVHRVHETVPNIQPGLKLMHAGTCVCQGAFIHKRVYILTTI